MSDKIVEAVRQAIEERNNKLIVENNENEEVDIDLDDLDLEEIDESELEDIEDEDDLDIEDEDLDLDEEVHDILGKSAKDALGKGHSGVFSASNIIAAGTDKKNKATIKNKPLSPLDKSGVPSVKPKGGSQGADRTSVKEELSQMFDDETLSEDFKNKAATIFEAAVNKRVSDAVKALDEHYEQELASIVESFKEELTEQLDKYLDFVVEQWVSENQIAIEYGLKNQIAENFINGLKNLLEENYIDVPDEKYDALTEMSSTIDNLQYDLEEQIETNIELKSQLLESQCNIVFAEVSKGLVDTDVERLRELAEGVSYDTVEEFENKINILKDSFTKKDTKKNRLVTEENQIVINNDETPQPAPGIMGIYEQSLTRFSGKR